MNAIVALDALAHAGLVEPDVLRGYAALHPGWRGVRIIVDRLRYVEPGTESPMETRLRLTLVRGGLPRPRVQMPVYGPDGSFLGRPDLSYPEDLLGVEYDGRYHADVEVFVADRQRQNRLLRAGWRLLHYTTEDVYRRPDRIITQVRAALSLPRLTSSPPADLDEPVGILGRIATSSSRSVGRGDRRGGRWRLPWGHGWEIAHTDRRRWICRHVHGILPTTETSPW